jgi:2-oxoisovalerate dehydrogenase E2 component (dihydrolipoyl transacylase)
MASFQFKLPDIGEGIAESEVAAWHVAEGDRIEEDQRLVDMLTDKAAVEIPSPVSGKVVKLHAAVGDKVAVGGLLVTLETSAESLPDDAVSHPSPSGRGAGGEGSSAPSSTASPSPGAARHPLPEGEGKALRPVDDYYEARPAAAPSVRLRAREMGLDLHRIRGSGPSGRILLEDLQARAAEPIAKSTARAVDEPDRVEQIKIIGLRRKIAEAMERSSRRIPHFSYVEEVDVTELEALRQHLNEQHGKTRGKLTLLPFLIRALVKTLPEFPQINATYDDEAGIVSRHTAVHVGIATQTQNGLVVPVVQAAQRHDLWQAAKEVARVSEAARSGKATRQELSGSTITITSLGKLGGIVTTPVINAPEVAIIGVNAMVERAVVRNGQVVVRSMMNLSSSFDHRIVDGFDAASFIQRIKALLEHPATLFID